MGWATGIFYSYGLLKALSELIFHRSSSKVFFSLFPQGLWKKKVTWSVAIVNKCFGRDSCPEIGNKNRNKNENT